jgi:TrmH family RNA methyltransferase
MQITSQANSHLKEIRKLGTASARAKLGRFVAEGEDFMTAAHAAGRAPLYVTCAPGLGQGRANWFEVERGVLNQASRLGSGTRVIGVFEQRWSPITGPLVIALWGVSDPGNVGTVIRAAHAFGASCVALGPGCADPYGPKAVRASMGSIFATPLARFANIGDLPGEVIGLAPGKHPALQGPLSNATLLIGGERDGLPPEALASASRTAAIPQRAADSLNAAMAATVALYEVTRMAAP